VLPAALCNSLLVYYLVLDLWRGERGFRFPRLAWLGFIASTAGLFSYLVFEGPGWDISPVYLLATGLVTAAALRLLTDSQRTPISGQEAGTPGVAEALST